MAQFERHFTVEEANEMLPEIREVMTEIQGLRDRLVVDWEKALPVLRSARMNGGGSETSAYLTDLQQLNARLRRMAEMGVQLKDLERGLVDFPSWREDREVFLCWHLEEERVGYWHELDTGFAGRREI